MSELFREIEEDIRRERMDKLWFRFGRVLIAASIAVVLMTAVYVFWQNHQQAHAQEQTAKLMHGIDLFNNNDYKEAISVFTELSADDHASYYGVAMLHKGQAQAASGDKEGAAKTFADLAKHDKVFGALALMQSPYDPNHPLQPDKISPLYYTQSEWTGWGLLSKGKKDAAGAQFTALRDSADAPNSMRQRLQEVLQMMNVDSGQTMSDQSIKKGEQKK